MKVFNRKGLATLALIAAAPLALTACSMGNNTASPGGTTSASAPAASSQAPAPSSTAPSAAPSTEAAAVVPFGAGCSAVPKTGKGSFDGMSQDPVATAASNNPALSTLVTAVKAAKLVDTLNNAEGITVFAPANSAFEAMDQATLKKALDDPSGLLTTVLTYHVVSGRLTPEQLAGSHKTLQGGTIEVTGSGEAFTVNGNSKVVCGNVQTANATVYIIDTVLLPK